MDDIDAMLEQRAAMQPATVSNTADPIDAMLQQRASVRPFSEDVSNNPAELANLPDLPRVEISGTSQNAAQPNSAMDRFGQGVRDPFDAGAQDLVHALPKGVVDGVNGFADKLGELPGIGGFLKNIGIGNSASSDQIDQSIHDRENQYQAQRQAAGNTGFDGSRMLGNMLGTAPLLAAAPTGAGVGMGALLGAGNGALTPVTDTSKQSFGEQKGGQIGVGALTGGIAAPVMKAVGGAISGVGDQAQQLLAKAGVRMTPGQIFGGALARTEEKLSSVPVLGDMIKNAQQRSVQSFNAATYNKVLEPLGEKYSGPVGSDGIEAVRQRVSSAYDSALSKLHFNGTDPGFQADITSLGSLAKNLPEQQAKQFINVLKTQIFDKLGPQGTMDGQALKGVQNELRTTAQGYSSDISFDNKQLGAAIGEIKAAVDKSLMRTNAPENTALLKNADAAYANYVRLRSAAGSQGAGNNGGVFTAAQLNNAVRSNDKSVGKGSFATGNALMQDFSTAGQSVLGSKYPDSGSPGRAMLSWAIPALAGHAMLPTGVAPVVGGLGAMAAAPYTDIGQKIAQALLMSRMKGMPEAGQAVSKYGSALAPALGAALLNPTNR